MVRHSAVGGTAFSACCGRPGSARTFGTAALSGCSCELGDREERDIQGTDAGRVWDGVLRWPLRGGGSVRPQRGGACPAAVPTPSRGQNHPTHARRTSALPLEGIRKGNGSGGVAPRGLPAAQHRTNPLTARQMNCTVQIREMESLWPLLQEQAKLER